jgi:Ca-activated chloride channel family protein
MTRVVAYGVIAACACGVVAAAAQEPVFRSAGEIVRVFVTATDRDGRLVTDLTQSEFEVRDEGRAQPITVFDSSPKPIQLVVLLDVSGSMVGNLPLLRAATEQLAGRLGPDDVARVGTFGKEVVLGPAFTRDRRELLAALPESIDPEAPTPLWRAADQAMSAFEDNAERRRVVLVLSDGQDSGMTSFREKIVSPAEVIDRARLDEVMIYAVGMRSRRPLSANSGRIGIDAMRARLTEDLPDPGLARVAEESGGGYVEIRYGENLADAFARVADELHSQYLLGYVPPKRDGKVHKIDVRVSRDNVKPRGRKTYVAPRDK